MSTNPSRWVIVDDTNANITYRGAWFQDTGSQDSVGNFGSSYRSTLHGTKANASITYSFTGSRLLVYGTTNIRNDSGVIDPSWECFVDRISIGATKPFQFPENNWLLCQQATLVDGPHTLTINATVKREQTFWFDNIQYLPSESASLDSEAIMVDSKDPSLQFGEGWGALGATANMTGKPGSVFNFEFYGVSLSWYGFIPTELPKGSTTGSYSVDGQPKVNFLLKGSQENSPTLYNQKFFETQAYPAGPHKITVTYDGDGKSTPLTLDYLIIQNGTSTSPGSDNSGGSSKPNNTGPIVGGVVGGLVLLALVGLLVFLLRRRTTRRKNEIKLHEYDNPPAVVEPFRQSPMTTSAFVYSHPDSSYTGTNHPDSMTTYSAFTPSSLGGTSSAPYSGITSAISTLPTTNHTEHQRQPQKVLRDAEAAAAAARHHQPQRSVALSATSEVSPTSRVVMHEDSGIRMASRPDLHETVVEIPPQYTPG